MTASGADVEGPSVPAPDAPRYYLGIRRGWWIALCIVLLAAVDAVPFVGPYLALVVLLWMVHGLARGQERPERATTSAPAVGRRATDTAALSS